MPAMPDQVTYSEHYRPTRSTALFIYPSRVRPITTIYFTVLTERHTKFTPWLALRRGNRALLVLGTCQMLLRDGKLPLVFQGTAAKPVARRIPARSRHCRPNRTAGEWWKVVKFPTGAEGKRLQISRGVISVPPCLTANALAENRSPVSPPYRRKLVRCAKQRRSCVTFAQPPEEAGFFGAPGTARTAVTGAIRPECCPFDDLEVRVLPGHHQLLDVQQFKEVMLFQSVALAPTV